MRFFALRPAWLAGLLTTAFLTPVPATAAPPEGAAARASPAFPGAQGWAARTPGGRGGKILRVTTLEAAGPGSLAQAIATPGPRIVVFEVGGVIDLDRKLLTIGEPYLTIAGQTAPSPGITLIRGGIELRTHDVIIQHLRVRAGDAGLARGSGWDADTFSTQGGARDVIVDHCSMSWGIDENLSASGPRFTGKTPAEWRKGTSHRITYTNNIIADGLAHSTHPKGEHSKGSLIHDNVTDILIAGNLYANNMERNPLFKGGVQGAIVNNYIYNPGPRAVHYNLIAAEWGAQPWQNGRMTLLANVLRAGPSTPPDIALLMLGGSGDLELYERDNIAVDRLGRPLPLHGRYTISPARLIPLETMPEVPDLGSVMSAIEVQDAVIKNAGARPWDRDAVDLRVIADVIEGRGEIIDSQQQVEGYPAPQETRAPFVESDWDLSTMTRH
jgi:pectate lyase